MAKSHSPDSPTQLCLLNPDELRRMRRLVSRPQEGEVVPRKVPCRDGEEHVDLKHGYIQDALPGL